MATSPRGRGVHLCHESALRLLRDHEAVCDKGRFPYPSTNMKAAPRWQSLVQYRHFLADALDLTEGSRLLQSSWEKAVVAFASERGVDSHSAGIGAYRARVMISQLFEWKRKGGKLPAPYRLRLQSVVDRVFVPAKRDTPAPQALVRQPTRSLQPRPSSEASLGPSALSPVEDGHDDDDDCRGPPKLQRKGAKIFDDSDDDGDDDNDDDSVEVVPIAPRDVDVIEVLETQDDEANVAMTDKELDSLVANSAQPVNPSAWRILKADGKRNSTASAKSKSKAKAKSKSKSTPHAISRRLRTKTRFEEAKPALLKRPSATSDAAVLKRVYSKAYHTEELFCANAGFSGEIARRRSQEAGRAASAKWRAERMP